jgi:hypothetical protein
MLLLVLFSGKLWAQNSIVRNNEFYDLASQNSRSTKSKQDTKLFNAQLDLETESFPISVVISDLDLDGKNDVLVANFGKNSISVFRNSNLIEGEFSFDAKFEIETGVQPYHIETGDLDGDGKLDLVVANRGNNTVSAFLNTTTQIGIITFAGREEKKTGVRPRSVSIGDLDGDGKADLAVANAGDGTVSLYRNTSSGIGNISFEDKIDLSGSSPYFVSIEDLDQDGMADLILANSSLTDNSVSILKNISSNIGDLNFDTQLDYTTGLKPWSVSVGDFDGDNNMDLAVANLSNSSVSVFRNENVSPGIIKFSEKIDFTVGQDPHSIFIGDLNNDGLADMAVTNAASNSISVLRNTSKEAGNITFSIHEIYETGSQPFSVSGGDLNEDGKPELAVVNLQSYTLSILYNNTPPILDIKAFEHLSTYPNPVNDWINISGIFETYSVEILSLSGKSLFNGTNDTTINLSEFKRGIYFLKIVTKNGGIEVRKFIKK